MKVAIIPARGGSKRIVKKNIKLFCGKPIIGWTIEAVLRSNCFDKIIVSTDDDEIAEISRQHGAETPFIRPAHLADDFSITSEVIAHAIQWLENQQLSVELACCLYATAPFLQPGDIHKSLATMLSNDIDYCFSATTFSFPVQRAIRLSNDKTCEMVYPENFSTRSQDLETLYHDAAQFYWGKTQAWINQQPFFTHRSMPYILPRHRVQDIDTLEDWDRAELMFKVLNEQNQ